MYVCWCVYVCVCVGMNTTEKQSHSATTEPHQLTQQRHRHRCYHLPHTRARVNMKIFVCVCWKKRKTPQKTFIKIMITTLNFISARWNRGAVLCRGCWWLLLVVVVVGCGGGERRVRIDIENVCAHTLALAMMTTTFVTIRDLYGGKRRVLSKNLARDDGDEPHRCCSCKACVRTRHHLTSTTSFKYYTVNIWVWAKQWCTAYECATWK